MSNINLSTGVILKAVRMNASIVPDRLSRFSRPKPPKVFIPEKGREEENPDDPRYIEALNEYRISTSMAVNDAVILFGTELISFPETIEGPNGPIWQEKAHLMGALSGEGPGARYLAWVKMVATIDEKDYKEIWEAVARMNGTAEKDVAAATERFPGNA